MTWPDLSTSIGLLLPRRCRWMPTAIVLHLTIQEAEVPPPVPQPLGSDIPAEMIYLHINVGGAHWVYCCWVEGCPDGPFSSHAIICSYMCYAPLGIKLTCSLCPSMFFNTDVLRWHGKWAHCSGSLDPTYGMSY